MSARLRDADWRATALAGTAMVLGLVLALAHASTAASLTVALTGLVLAAFVLAPRVAAAISRHPAVLVVLLPFLLLAAAFVLGGVGSAGPLPAGLDVLRAPWVLARTALLPVAVMTLAAAGGLVLIADAVRLRLGLGAPRAPWDDLTGAGSAPPPSPAPWRAVVGVLLVGWSAFLGVGLAGPYVSGRFDLQLLLLLLIAVAAATVIGTPLLIAALARREQAQAGGAWEQERRRFAAHLHDSVLQTLALVQRQAHDPVAVARLARRQEHALRAWMAGHSDLVRETLAGALRDVVADVEDESGAAVEVSIIGDRALEERSEALVGATREALRNATRHGGGAPVFVFAQIAPQSAEVFVRDEGPGFEPAAVPAERRGLRDAVVGRMAAAGGSATIESALGEGTEVTLRLGAAR
jgi:signal transduction histidine kinase